MLLKYYILLLLPLKAALDRGPSLNSLTGAFTIQQLFNVFFVLVNGLFIIVCLNQLLRNKFINATFVRILVLIFLFSLQPLFSYIFTQRIFDFDNYLKLLSWLTIIPLAFLAFQNETDIRHLKCSAIAAFVIVMISFVIANIFKIGPTAYGFGMLHIGFSRRVAPVSMAILTLLPLFFLPSGKTPKKNRISSITIFFIFLDFVLLLLIMKRSSLLAFVICIITILFLFAYNSYIRFSRKSFFIISIASVSSMLCFFFYISFSSPEIMKKRFKDITKYQETGEIEYLGAGRVKIAVNYLNYYKEQSFIKKILGIDLFGHIDKNRRGYLYSKFNISPHNDYIDVLIRSGMLGLIAYLGFLIHTFRRTWKYFRSSRDTLLATVSAVMLGMFSVYLVSSLAGIISRVLAMSCFAMLLGATLGIASRHTSLPNETV